MTALLLAFLALPGNDCSPGEARTVVRAAVTAARRHNVPERLLLAVVMGETKCSNTMSRPTYDGGRDVGYAQIHVKPGEDADDEQRRYLDPQANLNRAALILSWSKGVCTGRGKNWRGCKITVWALYNYRSKTWWPKVRGYLEALRDVPRS
jgi:hypothetical protein